MNTHRPVCRLLACLISYAILLCYVPTSFAGENSKNISSETTVYWVFDQEVYENIFSDKTALNNNDICATQTLVVQDSNAEDSFAELSATYTFDVDGDGSIDPITVSGLLKYCTYDSENIYSGVLDGITSVGGVICSVSAVVDWNPSTSKVNAGITIIPETAYYIEEYVFFALGDPVVTADMVSGIEFGDASETSSNISEISSPCTTALTATYVTKASASSEFSNSAYSYYGSGQTLEVKYCSSYNRVCVSVTTIQTD